MAAGKGSSNHLSDEELRKGLLDLGFSPGPVTSTTREVLVRKMKKLSLPDDRGGGTAIHEPTPSTGNGHDERSKRDVFISYSRDKNKFVMRLKKDLEANGYSVWVDTDDICTGADWHSDIGTALQNCRALIAVLTANYLESHYCRKELFMASREKKPVFPIMLEEVDFKSSKEGAGVSLAVADLNWVMFSGKSYNKAFPKLLEGLHHGGVEPSLRDKHH